MKLTYTILVSLIMVTHIGNQLHEVPLKSVSRMKGMSIGCRWKTTDIAKEFLVFGT